MGDTLNSEIGLGRDLKGDTRDFGTADPSASSIIHAVCSDVGCKRAENQDSFGFARTQSSQLYVVADGMGGTAGGSLASSLAVNVVLRAAFDEEGRLSEDSIYEGIKAANKLVLELGQKVPCYDRMGTTIVVLGVCGDSYFYANVGDSRLYYLRGEEFIQLSTDHTLVQQLVDSKKITPLQAKGHPISHVLVSSIGGSEQVEIALGKLEVPPSLGSKFILCCDGLTNEVSNKEIGAVVAALDPTQAVRSLVGLANYRGGKDNITVQILELGENQLSQTFEEGELGVFASPNLDEQIVDLLLPYGKSFKQIEFEDIEKEVVRLSPEDAGRVPADSPANEFMEHSLSDYSEEDLAEAEDEEEKDSVFYPEEETFPPRPAIWKRLSFSILGQSPKAISVYAVILVLVTIGFRSLGGEDLRDKQPQDGATVDAESALSTEPQANTQGVLADVGETNPYLIEFRRLEKKLLQVEHEFAEQERKLEREREKVIQLLEKEELVLEGLTQDLNQVEQWQSLVQRGMIQIVTKEMLKSFEKVAKSFGEYQLATEEYDKTLEAINSNQAVVIKKDLSTLIKERNQKQKELRNVIFAEIKNRLGTLPEKIRVQQKKIQDADLLKRGLEIEIQLLAASKDLEMKVLLNKLEFEEPRLQIVPKI